MPKFSPNESVPESDAVDKDWLSDVILDSSYNLDISLLGAEITISFIISPSLKSIVAFLPLIKLYIEVKIS
jgi:hypothetical protein